MNIKLPSSWGSFDSEILSKWKQLRAINKKQKKLATLMLPWEVKRTTRLDLIPMIQGLVLLQISDNAVQAIIEF